jgi:enterochelin esterase-like enzyme
MKPIYKVLVHLFFLAALLPACSPVPVATPLPTAGTTLATTTPPCTEKGSIGSERVPNPTQGFPISFTYYLPPCYASRPADSFPVLYMIALSAENRLSETDNTPMSLAERLIHSGKLLPMILIEPTLPVGYGSDAALAKDLVPYVDGRFRTVRSREGRGVGGISHGAAIAVRMAFQFPDTFGSVGLLSGGLAEGELDRFEGWVLRTAPERWPRVLIDVGDQDAIMSLTRNLLALLDKHAVPYTLNVGQGNHNWTFWSSQMESYLLWFSMGWKK